MWSVAVLRSAASPAIALQSQCIHYLSHRSQGRRLCKLVCSECEHHLPDLTPQLSIKDCIPDFSSDISGPYRSTAQNGQRDLA